MGDKLKAAGSARLLSTVSMIQGFYYVASGVWPLVHMRSFLAVTGPKEDLWLVRTVGLLLMVGGSALLTAAFKRRPGPEAVVIGIGTAAALAVIEIVYVFSGVIAAIYLLDAAAEIFFIAVWVIGGYRSPKIGSAIPRDDEDKADAQTS